MRNLAFYSILCFCFSFHSDKNEDNFFVKKQMLQFGGDDTPERKG